MHCGVYSERAGLTQKKPNAAARLLHDIAVCVCAVVHGNVSTRSRQRAFPPCSVECAILYNYPGRAEQGRYVFGVLPMCRISMAPHNAHIHTRTRDAHLCMQLITLYVFPRLDPARSLVHMNARRRQHQQRYVRSQSALHTHTHMEAHVWWLCVCECVQNDDRFIIFIIYCR